jgi:hypothetical protein
MYGGSLVSVHCTDELTFSNDMDSMPILNFTNTVVRINFWVISADTYLPPNYGILLNYKVELSDNVYTENFASNGDGLIDIEGIFVIYFNNETFINNGENNFQTQTYIYNISVDNGLEFFEYNHNDYVNDVELFLDEYYRQ